MSFQNLDVLKFYEELPFNIFGDLDEAEKQIKKFNPIDVYPELKKNINFNQKLKVIDFGCGGGWFVNGLSYHLGENIDVTGVDFNPTAINYANKIKDGLSLNSNFILSDLFKFESVDKFDLIVSLGALHHTNNCKEAIRKILHFGNNKAYLFLGLYHKYGRKPFLDFFENIKKESEESKFKKYKELHSIKDDKKLYSWFRDQVLHPHETQHTFEEMIDLFEQTSYKIESTSINKFEKIDDLNSIIEKEKKLFNYAEEKLKKKEYFPGFFIITAKNNN